MKSLMIFLSLVSQTFGKNTTDFCFEVFTDNIYIRESFRIKDHLFLFTSDNKTYRLDNFIWNGDNASYSGGEDLSEILSADNDLMVTVAVDYPNKGRRVIFISHGQVRHPPASKSKTQTFFDRKMR